MNTINIWNAHLFTYLKRAGPKKDTRRSGVALNILKLIKCSVKEGIKIIIRLERHLCLV